jgi:hypothetical protein
MPATKNSHRLFISRNVGLTALRDSYVLEFLDVPEHHKEKELRGCGTGGSGCEHEAALVFSLAIT